MIRKEALEVDPGEEPYSKSLLFNLSLSLSLSTVNGVIAVVVSTLQCTTVGGAVISILQVDHTERAHDGHCIKLHMYVYFPSLYLRFRFERIPVDS